MEPRKQNLYSIRYTMKPEDIMTFVSGLHEIQEQMIEDAVEKSGYKDAQVVLNHIMQK